MPGLKCCSTLLAEVILLCGAFQNNFLVAKPSCRQNSTEAWTWIWCVWFPQNPQADHCRLQEVGTYCQESRRLDQWVPELVLQERWRGPGTHMHEQKKKQNKRELSGFRYSWIVVARAGGRLERTGLDWTGPSRAGPSWLATSRNQRTQWLEINSSERRLVHEICFVQKTQNRKSDSHCQ